MTDKPQTTLEITARKLCVERGYNPDDLLPTKARPSYMQGDVQYPRWKCFRHWAALVLSSSS